jgi:hypothetical protein
MRYPAAEKLEIIRLVEQSSLSVRRGSVRNFVCERLVVNSYCIAQQSPIATA